MLKLNGINVDFKRFPNGETIINKSYLDCIQSSQSSQRYTITMQYESDKDLMDLYYLKKMIDAKILPSDGITSILDIQYMPYSRMDRPSKDYGFTLKWISEFINSLQFDIVAVLEPHSDVTLALLNNSEQKSVTQRFVYAIRKEYPTAILFFPDAGAQKRYGGMFDIPSLVGFKHRDFKSGDITELQVLGTVTEGDTIIIVDDLCSGGRTFLESAKKLKELGAGKVLLFVTHCENTIFKGDLLKTGWVDHIYTTDSIFKAYNEQLTDKITVFKL